MVVSGYKPSFISHVHGHESKGAQNPSSRGPTITIVANYLLSGMTLQVVKDIVEVLGDDEVCEN